MFYSKESLKLVSNHLHQCNGVACISIPLQFHFIKGDIIPVRFTTTSLLCLLAFSFCLSCKCNRVYMLPEISTWLLDSTMVCVPFLVQSFSAFSAPNAPLQVCYNSSLIKTQLMHILQACYNIQQTWTSQQETAYSTKVQPISRKHFTWHIKNERTRKEARVNLYFNTRHRMGTVLWEHPCIKCTLQCAKNRITAAVCVLKMTI